MTETAYGDVDDLFGQATDDGAYDDVDTSLGAGVPSMGVPQDPDTRLAAMLVVGALVALWAMGAALFRGSNQS